MPNKMTPAEEVCEIKQDITNGLRLGRKSGDYYPKYHSTYSIIKEFVTDAGGTATIYPTPEGVQLHYTFNQRLQARI